MRLSKICPSLAIGFYLRDSTEFVTFKTSIEKVRKMENCFFSLFQVKQESKQAMMEQQLKMPLLK